MRIDIYHDNQILVVILPSGMFFQLVKYGQVAVLENQMEFLFTSEHFDQVDQVWMF